MLAEVIAVLSHGGRLVRPTEELRQRCYKSVAPQEAVSVAPQEAVSSQFTFQFDVKGQTANG
jgi:hypothetical protein